MSLRAWMLIAACLFLTACAEDPARAIRIIQRSTVPAQPTVTFTPASLATEVQPMNFCPPDPEAAPGPSSLQVRGPCEFQHQGAVVCESMHDDFIVAITRKARNGGTVVVYLNVEQYHGPGSYDDSQLFVAAQGGTSIYRWSGETVHAEVGPNESFVSLRETALELEPLLTGCTDLVTSTTNHQFNCPGIGLKKAAVDTKLIVTGKLQCGAVRKTTEGQ